MGRKRSSRFKKAIDAQEQLEDIEKAQREHREKGRGPLIERTDKSDQRFDNFLKGIRKPETTEEFPKGPGT